MRALKKKWYLNIFLDALFFVLKESIRANDMSRKKWKANKKKKKLRPKYEEQLKQLNNLLGFVFFFLLTIYFGTFV